MLPGPADWHLLLIDELTALAASLPEALALVLYGSCAGGEADEWSDVDALLVLLDGTLDRYFPATDWLKWLGDVYALEQHADAFRSLTRLCFSDQRRLDLVLTTETAFTRIAAWPRLPFTAAWRTLFCRSAQVEKTLATLPDAPEPPAFRPTDLGALADDFGFKGVIAVHKVVRGDLLVAAHLALDLARSCLVLAMAQRDQGEAAWMDVLAGTSVSLRVDDPASILASIAASARRFDELAPDDAPRHGPLLELVRRARASLGLAGDAV